MGIENENFVLVGSFNTLSLVYMTEYYNNKKMINTSIFQKHIHKVKIFPSADDFTQVPFVMLVTNVMSAKYYPHIPDAHITAYPYISIFIFTFSKIYIYSYSHISISHFL